MSKKNTGKFREGDEIHLIAPFRCDGDDEITDEDFDRQIRENDPDALGVVVSVPRQYQKYYEVKFDGYRRTLYVNEDCIDFRITDEDVAEAIKSILGES